MPKITRFGVSLETDLLEAFDSLINKNGYSNRSEAIRDLIREALRGAEVAHGKGIQAGVLAFLYNHEKPGLLQKITRLFHDHSAESIASLHIHITHHLCLEVAILKGKAENLRSIGSRLRALKGVYIGDLLLVPTTNPGY